MVNSFEPGDAESDRSISRILDQYAVAIEPWARHVGMSMLRDVDRRDLSMWHEISRDMSREIRHQIHSTPLGLLYQQRLNDQVGLITSLPREAAERVHKLTVEGLSSGRRASDIAKEIMRSGEVSASRANMIARSEVARTSSMFTQERAQRVGSVGYIWRTSHDADVRKSHREMEGKFVRWDTAPTLSDGTVCHAGCIYNCRCYPEPVIRGY